MALITQARLEHEFKASLGLQIVLAHSQRHRTSSASLLFRDHDAGDGQNGDREAGERDEHAPGGPAIA